MLTASAKQKILLSLLESLPPPVAERLARVVELDRMTAQSNLPHDLILAVLRPALRLCGQTERMPSPQRLFCQPFEDILSSMPRREKQKGRIARDSILPVWNWLRDVLVPDAAQIYVRSVTVAVLHYDIPEARGHARDFWQTASQAMQAALSSDAGLRAAFAYLGDELLVADAREVALLLGAGPQVMQIHEKLPRSAPALTEDLVWELREIYDGLVRCVPDAAPYVAVIAMNRLARPWEALRLPLMIARKTQDTLISSTDMGLAGELLLLDIADHAAAIRAVRQPAFDVDELLRHLNRFTQLSSAIVREVEIRRDGRWGQNLFKDRALVAEAMGEIMKRAPRDILAALPMVKSGAYGNGPRVPDLEKPSDPVKNERALRYARLLVGCRHLAAAASIHAAQQAAYEEVVRELQTYNEAIVRDIRKADERRHAETYFTMAVELTAILFSEEEAEHMRRRARAALAA